MTPYHIQNTDQLADFILANNKLDDLDNKLPLDHEEIIQVCTASGFYGIEIEFVSNTQTKVTYHSMHNSLTAIKRSTGKPITGMLDAFKSFKETKIADIKI